MLIPATLCFDFEKLKFSNICPIAPIPRRYGLLVLIFVFYGKYWSREKFFGCHRPFFGGKCANLLRGFFFFFFCMGQFRGFFFPDSSFNTQNLKCSQVGCLLSKTERRGRFLSRFGRQFGRPKTMFRAKLFAFFPRKSNLALFLAVLVSEIPQITEIFLARALRALACYSSNLCWSCGQNRTTRMQHIC